MKFQAVGILVLVSSISAATCFAQPTALPRVLEKEVISQLDEMGPDAWEENDVEARFDAVLYDDAAKTLTVDYETRTLDSKQKFVKQTPIVVQGISSEDAIMDTAPNGYRSLNQNISNTVLGIL